MEGLTNACPFCDDDKPIDEPHCGALQCELDWLDDMGLADMIWDDWKNRKEFD